MGSRGSEQELGELKELEEGGAGFHPAPGLFLGLCARVARLFLERVFSIWLER